MKMPLLDESGSWIFFESWSGTNDRPRICSSAIQHERREIFGSVEADVPSQRPGVCHELHKRDVAEKTVSSAEEHYRHSLDTEVHWNATTWFG